MTPSCSLLSPCWSPPGVNDGATQPLNADIPYAVLWLLDKALSGPGPHPISVQA